MVSTDSALDFFNTLTSFFVWSTDDRTVLYVGLVLNGFGLREICYTFNFFIAFFTRLGCGKIYRLDSFDDKWHWLTLGVIPAISELFLLGWAGIYLSVPIIGL